LNCLGQLSSETLIVSLVILAMGVAIVSQYFPVKDSTTAMEMLKIGALKKIDSMQQKYTISKIDYVIAGSAISLCLYTSPSLSFSADEETSVENSILASTSFTSVEINPPSCG